jgi:hypothetical protein
MAALYQVENPFTKVMAGVRGASQSLASMGQKRDRKTETEGGAGQGLMDAGSVGLAGYQMYKGSGLGGSTAPTTAVNPALMPQTPATASASIPASAPGELASSPAFTTPIQSAVPVTEAMGAATPLALGAEGATTALPAMYSGAVGSTAAAAAPVAATSLAGAVAPAAAGATAGATTGAATGSAAGPYGALAGAVIGGLVAMFAS